MAETEVASIKSTVALTEVTEKEIPDCNRRLPKLSIGAKSLTNKERVRQVRDKNDDNQIYTKKEEEIKLKVCNITHQQFSNFRRLDFRQKI